MENVWEEWNFKNLVFYRNGDNNLKIGISRKLNLFILSNKIPNILYVPICKKNTPCFYCFAFLLTNKKKRVAHAIIETKQCLVCVCVSVHYISWTTQRIVFVIHNKQYYVNDNIKRTQNCTPFLPTFSVRSVIFAFAFSFVFFFKAPVMTHAPHSSQKYMTVAGWLSSQEGYKSHILFSAAAVAALSICTFKLFAKS